MNGLCGEKRDRIAAVKALFALEKQERKQNVQDSCHLLYYMNIQTEKPTEEL